MDCIPTRQRPARDLLEMGLVLPFFAHDLDQPVNFHVTLVVLPRDLLEKLTVAARKHAAELLPNEHDNRSGNLDYPATPREMHAMIRHTLLNRTPGNDGKASGYMRSYDNILHRIAAKGVDVEARQLAFKRQVCALIAAHYGEWARKEGEYYLWRCETERSAA